MSTPSSPSSSVIGGDLPEEDYHESGPPTTVGDERWEGHYFPAVPWPGNMYIITERSSGRPVIRSEDDGRVVLGEPDDDDWDLQGPKAAANGRWYCVESNNYLGFQDPQTSRYLGHNIHDNVMATARSIGDWEHVIVRPHPNGGFQLMSKYWISSLMLLTIDADGKSLVRRMHGSTLFDFKKV